MPQNRQEIMKFLCLYLNRKQVLGFYVLLSSFYTAKEDVKAFSRLSMQKRMQKAFKKFFGEDRVFDVGDISKLTNLLDALGLIAKKYCAINGEKLANRYMLNPVFRDGLFRKQMLGILACSFRGKYTFKFAKRLNKRYSTFGNYKTTIMTIWRNVPDSFIGLTPTHESYLVSHKKSNDKVPERDTLNEEIDLKNLCEVESASGFNGAPDFWETSDSDNDAEREERAEEGVPLWSDSFDMDTIEQEILNDPEVACWMKWSQGNNLQYMADSMKYYVQGSLEVLPRTIYYHE